LISKEVCYSMSNAVVKSKQKNPQIMTTLNNLAIVWDDTFFSMPIQVVM
jgi:hypothetical protein